MNKTAKHIIAIMAAIVVAYAGFTTAEAAANLAIGSAMPAFNLKNVDGSMISSGQYDDKKALVVIFSCNHCPFAQAYESRMIALGKEYQAKGVQFVLINPNDVKKQPQDSYENMQKRATEKSYPFPYLYDESQAIAKAYDAGRTPEAYVFGPDRKLVYWGRIDDSTEEGKVKKHDLKDALDLLLAGTPNKIEQPITKAFGCTIKWKA